MKKEIIILISILIILLIGYLSVKFFVKNENTNFVKVDLSGTNLIEAPNYIFSQKNIQELDLSDNNMTGSLPAEIRNLKSLKILNISHNQFTGLPAEVGQLKNLEVLNISYNNLTGLPNEIGNLRKLKTLDISGNHCSETDLMAIEDKLPNLVIIDK